MVPPSHDGTHDVMVAHIGGTYWWHMIVAHDGTHAGGTCWWHMLVAHDGTHDVMVAHAGGT